MKLLLLMLIAGTLGACGSDTGDLPPPSCAPGLEVISPRCPPADEKGAPARGGDEA